MDCEKMRKYFDDYIVGELDQSIEIQLNEHLSECKDCQNEIKEKEVLIGLLRTSQKFEPSGEVFRRIRDTVKVGKKEKRKLFWGFPKNFVYATAAFFLGVVLMRTIDILILGVEENPQVEIQYESPGKVHFADTVQFHSAPPKNLARML